MLLLTSFIILDIYLIILEILRSNSLKMVFHKDCINRDTGVCTIKQKTTEDYLNYFLESEKKECIYFEQVAESMNDVLQFCIDMENNSWYGGAETTFQHWPLNILNWTDNAYVTKEFDSQAVSFVLLNLLFFYSYIIKFTFN